MEIMDLTLRRRLENNEPLLVISSRYGGAVIYLVQKQAGERSSSCFKLAFVARFPEFLNI
jgi:hypothetical protein